MTRSPHLPHLTLTVGGYSWAIWTESQLATPIIYHYTEKGDLFTSAAWSLTQPGVILMADEAGKLQAWDIRCQRSEPFQSQDITGNPLNHVSAYEHWEPESGAKKHFVSAADDEGSVVLLELPKHLRECEVGRLDAVLDFTEAAIHRQKERLRREKTTEEEEAAKLAKDSLAKDEDIDALEEKQAENWGRDLQLATETTAAAKKVGDDLEKEYLKVYFQREKAVLENVFGEDWRRFVAMPELPRKKYYVEPKRRDSSEDRRKAKELALKARRKKGASIFRKY